MLHEFCILWNTLAFLWWFNNPRVLLNSVMWFTLTWKCNIITCSHNSHKHIHTMDVYRGIISIGMISMRLKRRNIHYGDSSSKLSLIATFVNYFMYIPSWFVKVYNSGETHYYCFITCFHQQNEKKNRIWIFYSYLKILFIGARNYLF